MEEKIILETITWSAPEYLHAPKSNDWLWTIGIVAVVGAVLAFWLKNPLFGIFILLSATVLIMFRVRVPKDISYEINSDGLKMQSKLIPFKKVKGFTIKDEYPNAKLLIEINTNFLPIQSIPIPQELARKIDTELKKIIPVLELNESQLIQFADKLGV